ncbi:MAG: Vitamin B12-binding protein [Gemmatimonadaceae bacterium]|nr:Vitamin B12-binding protein [Gemmatimonadaceae bacterium]
MRLISLCPSLTELLFDLGAGPEVVGRTKFCVHPQGLVDRIEKLGGTKNPKLDRIVALQPDIVYMNEEENRREDAEALLAHGVRVDASMPRTVEETAVMVETIAASAGRGIAGARIAGDIRKRAARVRASVVQSGRAVTFAYLIWREPYMTVSDATFVGALLSLAGGVNVFGAMADRYPEVTALQLARARPQVVLLSTEPFPFDDRHADELARATGLGRGRFRIVDGELLSWHGSRTARGIDYADDVLSAVQAGVSAGTDDGGRKDRDVSSMEERDA